MSTTTGLAQAVYASLAERQQTARRILGREALTTAEKILYAHLIPARLPQAIRRGETTLMVQPDRVAMQDATAQMAILQFMQAARQSVAVPSTVHCDHLIRAQEGAQADNDRAGRDNAEVYEFLRSAAAKYGMGFWHPGSGIIHQVVLEQYAFPGGLMLGSDSHTPNAGGLGMIAIGVGGADVADVMAGLPWEVRAPRLVGVRLSGRLGGWTTPKDVILRLCGLLTTKGGANKIIEYFGPGCETISATGKATITNMGAELGATTSVFPYDAKMAAYLRATNRAQIADLADAHAAGLRADADVWAHPERYYDEVVDIDLSTLEPHVVGPHTPDRARPLSAFAADIVAEGWPQRLSAALIGSCTNSSYEDLERAAQIARQASAVGLRARSTLWITPGSEQVRQTIVRDGQLGDFEAIGAVTLSNACGPCIGNWDRRDLKPGEPNAIITSFNRNFPKRNDGSADTLAFIASPDIVMAMALAGSTTFNPLCDALETGNGALTLTPPEAPELPPQGFALSEAGYEAPPADRTGLRVAVSPNSTRLELLAPFAPWDGHDFIALPVLLKTQGQTTTDHISPAGKDWLPLRGHLSGISHNLLLGAVDAQTGACGEPVRMPVCGVERGVSPWALAAMAYKEAGQGFVIVGDENYGEGSSREHAAMTPRFLGCKAVIARSFARIHETNLKKQGVLPLTFANPSDYTRIAKGDTVTMAGLDALAPGEPLTISVSGTDGSQRTLTLRHTLTQEQIAWFRAGSAMNAANAS